jgi:hypothetical protein
MPQLLELSHLPEEHGVTQVEIRSRRVETGLHAQRPAQRQTRLQRREGVASDRALQQQLKGFRY